MVHGARKRSQLRLAARLGPAVPGVGSSRCGRLRWSAAHPDRCPDQRRRLPGTGPPSRCRPRGARLRRGDGHWLDRATSAAEPLSQASSAHRHPERPLSCGSVHPESVAVVTPSAERRRQVSFANQSCEDVVVAVYAAGPFPVEVERPRGQREDLARVVLVVAVCD